MTTENLQRVMRHIEEQRNTALAAAAVNGAHAEALAQQLDQAGQEIAALRAELATMTHERDVAVRNVAFLASMGIKECQSESQSAPL